MISNKPIFITGIYRSGTTLISRILDNHPDLNITYDSVHFMRFSFEQYNPINNESNYTNLIQEIETRLSKRWKIEVNSKEIIKKIKNEEINYAQVYSAIMSELLLDNSNAKRWGEKTNMCWRKIPDFLEMFHDGKTIVMIRDPRDVLISFKNMTTEPGLRYLDSIFASLDSFQYTKKFQNELSPKNFEIIKFEDLVNNPKKIIKNLCKFLEIEFKDTMLDSTQFKDKSKNKWEGNSAFNKKIIGISKDTVGRWKNQISKIELYFLEMILQEQMINFGYSLESTSLNKNEHEKLFEILNDDFIKKRYQNWLKTGKGHENYPNDPIKKAHDETK